MKLNNLNIIKSISYNQDEIIKNIIELHCPIGIECDVTYSKGNFYKEIRQPKYKFDLNPQTTDTIKADCRNLPVSSSSVRSIMFDPPFVIGVGPSLKTKRKGQNIITNRFTSFKSRKEMLNFYFDSIKELYRILQKYGILIVKCQDVVACGKNHFSHCEIFKMAEDIGFKSIDLFILIAKNRIISGKIQKQMHARKYHSYFWVFKKG